MNTPVIVWTAIIGLFVATIAIRFAVALVKYFHENHIHGIISSGTEREEFFLPGDPKDEEEDLLYEED